MDHEILKENRIFFPRALSDELLFELRLAPVNNVVIGSDETQLAYELTNIQLEYEFIHSQELAYEALSNYTNEKRFMFEHATHLKTISADKGSDTIINESIIVPKKSMKGLILLFNELCDAGARDSDKTFNHGITGVKVIARKTANKVFSQGMEKRDMWEEVFRRFGKEKSAMNATDFYAGDRFALLVDLRTR